MPVKPRKVIQDLKEDKYAPVYFLTGEEPYYIDYITGYIEENALDETGKSMNLTVTYGGDTDLQSVLMQAKSYPMMSDRQVVIVKEAQEMKGLDKDEGKKLLSQYVQNPLPSTILVFAWKKKPDKRKSLTTTLDQYAVLVESGRVYDNQIPDWIEEYVSEKGYSITQKAVMMLHEFVGGDLERLANEIDKLLLNISGQSEITEDHVQANIGISKHYNVFELQKALVRRNAGDVFKIVDYFEKDPKNNPAIPIIAMLYQFFSKVLLAHQKQQADENELARFLQINKFFVKDYYYARKAYNTVQLMEIIHYLREADLRTKGVENNSMNDGEILKEMASKILHA